MPAAGAATAAPAAGRGARRAPQRSRAPRRMTFKDRHALETLPTRIAALQAEIAD